MRERISLWAWAAVSIAYVAAVVWAASVLPDIVPTHFDGLGRADGWSSRRGAVGFWIGMGAFVLCGLPALIWLLTRGDGTGVNIPHKDYWFAPENKPRLQRMFVADGLVFTVLTGGLMLVLLVATTRVAAQGGDSMPPWFFATTVVLYLAAMLGFTWHLVRTRYVPPGP